MAKTYICVDDHVLFAQAFTYLMQVMEGFVSVGTFNQSETALEFIRQNPPDYLFTDLNLPGMNGIELIQLIRLSNFSTRILVVSMISDALVISKALECGANGFISKNTDYDELQLAIQTVSNQQIYLPPAIKAEIEKLKSQTEGNHHRDDTGIPAPLSEREIEIIRLIAQGYNNAQIGEALFLSPLTVKTHRANILRKLNLNNSASLIHYASRTGII